MERKSIGSFIAALRRANGLTQKQLAEKLNVSDKAVSRWERDECAPDLSLIPVIAEIFDVTADELLCGERRTNSDEVTKPKRIEKQKQRILTQAMSKFRLQSLISFGISLAALITMIILEMLIENHYLTLLFTSILIIASTVCEAVFLGNIINSSSDEEFDDISTDKFRVRAVDFSKILFAVNFAILFIYIALLSFLPFCSGVNSNSFYEMFSALSPNNPSHSIFSPDVILIALLYAGGAVILFKAIWSFVLKALAKRNIYAVDERGKRLIEFKKRFLTVATAAIAVTLLICVQAGSYNFIWSNIIVSGIQFDSPEAFKEYAEADAQIGKDAIYTLAGLTVEVISGDTTVNYDLDEEEWYSDEEIVDSNGNVLLTFKWKNSEMYTYSYDHENPETTIVAQTQESLYQAQAMLRLISTAVIMLEIIVTYVLYAVLLRRKKKQLGAVKNT